MVRARGRAPETVRPESSQRISVPETVRPESSQRISVPETVRPESSQRISVTRNSKAREFTKRSRSRKPKKKCAGNFKKKKEEIYDPTKRSNLGANASFVLNRQRKIVGWGRMHYLRSIGNADCISLEKIPFDSQTRTPEQ